MTVCSTVVSFEYKLGKLSWLSLCSESQDRARIGKEIDLALEVFTQAGGGLGTLRRSKTKRWGWFAQRVAVIFCTVGKTIGQYWRENVVQMRTYKPKS